MKRIFLFKPAIILLFTSLFLCFSCNTSNKVKGGVIGATAGGAVGGVIGSKSDRTAVGVLIGAAVGGAIGATIGHYMDKQAKEIEEELPGAQVQRIEEGILVTLESGLVFDVDSEKVNPAINDDLKEFANILQKYKDTEILLEGHTDSQGSVEYNQGLSERRARAVYKKLTDFGVRPSRLNTIGYGETQPIADNDSATGRQKNRRVDIAIFANENLKEEAKKGNLNN